MIQRGGEGVIKMLANVQQQTIKPIIQAKVSAGTLIYTDEYDIYARLGAWGYTHKQVCHSGGGGNTLATKTGMAFARSCQHDGRVLVSVALLA